ncbi:MAG: outer membrane beta-barrel domain-containing protein [Proteobacteria bacterium]|nr:outer membrane beta-barrel domain-containing protein [Pseudomonadota bacterium]
MDHISDLIQKINGMIIILLVGIAAHHSNLNAQTVDLDPNEIRGSVAKKPIAVLQNRFFLKSMRPEFGVLYGSVLNESYTKSTLTGARISMFVNEWVGAEAQMIKVAVSDSDDRKALNDITYRKKDDPSQLVSPDPEVNPIRGITDLSVIAAPFYGKLSLLDWAIVYTDLYGSLGLANVKTDQGAKTAITMGGGIRTYWATRWSTRLDFRNRSYTETRGGKSTRKNAWSFDLGISVLAF